MDTNFTSCLKLQLPLLEIILVKTRWLGSVNSGRLLPLLFAILVLGVVYLVALSVDFGIFILYYYGLNRDQWP